MSGAITGQNELQRRGADYGRELASALVLAVSRGRGDRVEEKAMTRVVLREIRRAVDWLRESGLESALVDQYERACRLACKDELLRSMPVNENRRAAMRAA